jgi:hypothetical protein
MKDMQNLRCGVSGVTQCVTTLDTEPPPSRLEFSKFKAMVLTRRASKCILRWLPNELLSTITTFAPLADKVSLARVSKVIHALVIPSLYRTVVLHNYAQLRRFSELLIAKPERANAVRAFYMSDIAADSCVCVLEPATSTGVN